MERLIAEYKGMFKLLDGWTITYDDTVEYKNQCAINPAKKQATIYEWTGDDEGLGNFIFHEILHMNFRAVGNHESKECFDNEETFVRDICSFMDRIRSDS